MTSKFLAKVLIVIGLTINASYALGKQIPMWENVSKTPAMLKADKAFVDNIHKQTNGKIKKASFRAIQLGWKFVSKNNPDMAIRRFNQAWLLEPKNPNIHWGFAVATHLQNAPLSTVERHFRKAEKLKKNNAALFADHGRILEQRGKSKKAIKYFKKALAIKPNLKDALIGMVRASRSLGDTATANNYRKKLK